MEHPLNHDWDDFKSNPDKYITMIEYYQKQTGITRIIGGLETPGIGQVNDIDADIVHLLRTILQRIKDYEVARVCTAKFCFTNCCI